MKAACVCLIDIGKRIHVGARPLMGFLEDSTFNKVSEIDIERSDEKPNNMFPNSIKIEVKDEKGIFFNFYYNGKYFIREV